MPAYDAYSMRRKMEVMYDTWGHLAPVSGRRYDGWIVFSKSEYSGQGTSVIATHFGDDNDDLSGPWFYDDLLEMVSQLNLNNDLEDGHVYKWTGTYIRTDSDDDRDYVATADGEGVFNGSFRTVYKAT